MRNGTGNGAAILLAAAAAAAAGAAAQPAAAQAPPAETIVYKYDVRGRLIEVRRTGTVNHGVVTAYGYDKADNRLSKTTTGSPNPPPP